MPMAKAKADAVNNTNRSVKNKKVVVPSKYRLNWRSIEMPLIYRKVHL